MMLKYMSVNGVNGVHETLKPCQLMEEDFVCINVAGMHYETLESTLQRFPSTLLGNRHYRQRYYVKSRNTYFFDRNRQCFEAILYYYQSNGILIRPPNIPMMLFAEEISFFDLGEEAFMKLQKNEGYIQEEIELPTKVWQRRIWQLFEHPDSSLGARILASWSVLVIVTSITVFCMETMPMFNLEERRKQAFEMKRQQHANKSSAHNHTPTEVYIQPWFSLELGCIVWFSLEYVMRLISSPNKCKFCKSFLNIIDLVAILPYFIQLSIHNGDTTPLSVLRVVRLVRVFRIFKLSRHSLGLRILGNTLRASVSELGMLIFFLLISIILYSSAMFYAEEGKNDMFVSIPDAFWFSLVTMTTVGYGDKVPKTLPGKIIGSLCAITGVLTIALPVPVIVANFEFFYKRDTMMNNYKRQSESAKQKSEKNNCECLLNKDTKL